MSLTPLNNAVDSLVDPVVRLFKDNAPSQLIDLVSKIAEYNKPIFGLLAAYGVYSTFNALYPNFFITKVVNVKELTSPEIKNNVESPSKEEQAPVEQPATVVEEVSEKKIDLLDKSGENDVAETSEKKPGLLDKGVKDVLAPKVERTLITWNEFVTQLKNANLWAALKPLTGTIVAIYATYRNR